MSYAITAESALIVPLSGLPGRLADMRALHDPVAAMGVPLHVTAIIPFRPAARLGPELRAEIAAIAGRIARQDFRIARLGRFPGNLHLVPDGAAPLVDLIRALAASFPDCPPYEGRFSDIHIHATLASGDDAMCDAVAQAATAHLPFQATADRLDLIVREGRDWRLDTSFPFEGG